MNTIPFAWWRLFRLITLLTWIMNMLVSTSAARAEAGTQSELTAITGTGAGRVVVSPTAAGRGTFVAQVTVNIHNAAPNTMFTVTRAIDLIPDGYCTSSAFAPMATLTTSEGGAGAVHFVRESGLVSGTQFDLQLRVIGDGTILESECMTVTVK